MASKKSAVLTGDFLHRKGTPAAPADIPQTPPAGDQEAVQDVKAQGEAPAAAATPNAVILAAPAALPIPVIGQVQVERIEPTVACTLRLPEGLHAALKMYAAQARMPSQAVMMRALVFTLDQAGVDVEAYK